MSRALSLALVPFVAAASFAACSSGGSSGATTGASSTQGTGGATTTTGITSAGGGSGTGGAGTTTSAAGTGGSTAGTGGATGTGGGTTSSGGAGGEPVDAGPDVSFTYDAGPTDAGVGADSACAADVVGGKKRPIDIIWAVDTSGSMSEEIAQIKANINTQFSDILAASGLDYQVIMIAARGLGAFQVCVAPPLGGLNCGANPPLYHPVNQTVASTNALSLILSTYDSANLALNWSKLLRMNAVKVFIVVTDDNSSLSGNSFDAQLLAKPPAGMFGTAAARNYVFHSIIGVTAGDPAVKCPSAVNTGAQYQVVSNLTGGKMLPVCAADYSAIFNEIASGIVGDLACEVAMPVPSGGGAIDPDNVAMQFVPSNGAPLDVPRVMTPADCNGDGWYYDDNAMPTKLLLCPATCATAKGDQGGKINILVGCLSG
ncbi:MAG: hypothetical protein U0359_29965 [Byssovorax sp.]